MTTRGKEYRKRNQIPRNQIRKTSIEGMTRRVISCMHIYKKFKQKHAKKNQIFIQID